MFPIIGALAQSMGYSSKIFLKREFDKKKKDLFLVNS